MKINRTSSTVPFGYKLSEDQKVYEPVEKELELLDKAFDYVRTCGAAKAARWLTVASGRRISNPGLTKRMNKGLHLQKQKRKNEVDLLNKKDSQKVPIVGHLA